MESEYPDAFRCPISLELMSDPVILTSGHTFDRASIQRWLDAGNLTCPVTKLPLPTHPPLIPNHALRGLISTFAPLRPPKPQPSPSSPSNPKSLAAALLSSPTDPAALSAALRLAKRDATFRRFLADAGAAPLLLRHDLHDLSLSLLLHLSLDGDDARVGLVADGALDGLSDTLRRRGPPAALAATLLTSLAVVEVNKCTIGAHPSIIPALAALIRDGKPRERREAATALYELCKFPENRKRAVRAGAVPALIHLARSGSERSVEVLTLLAKSREGRDQMGAFVGFIGILAEVLRDGSSRGVEHALSALDLVCSNNDVMASEARREGVLAICLRLIGESNEKIAKNAIGLARTLQKSEFVSLI